MTTQTARKGQPGHVPEDRERRGPTPKQQKRIIRWTGVRSISVVLRRRPA